MQDNAGKIGCAPKEKPTVKPFLADKSTKGRESFECCTFDHSDNSPCILFRKASKIFWKELMERTTNLFSFRTVKPLDFTGFLVDKTDFALKNFESAPL